jgi:hypothetical protein
VSPFAAVFSLFKKAAVDMRLDHTIQKGLGRGIVIPFRARPEVASSLEHAGLPAAGDARQRLKELKVELRCIQKEIRILEGLDAHSRSRKRRQISV